MEIELVRNLLLIYGGGISVAFGIAFLDDFKCISDKDFEPKWDLISAWTLLWPLSLTVGVLKAVWVGLKGVWRIVKA